MSLTSSAVVVGLTAILFLGVKIGPPLLKKRPILELSLGGDTKPAFSKVKQVFRENFENGLEGGGASFAVYHKDRVVVDLWGGYADLESQRKWEKNTLSVVYSATKAVTALVGAMLVDRGVLDYDIAVMRYWPEFGQNGKENITVRMLLSHQAGLAALDTQIKKEDITRNHKHLGRLFEEQRPNWPPGTARGYHAITYGWLLDQLLRRVDIEERSLGTFIREELTKDNKIDFHVGLPKSEFYRVARQYAPSWREILRNMSSKWERVFFHLQQLLRLNPSSLSHRVLNNPSWFTLGEGELVMNDPEILAMEIGGANGVGTAKGLAAFFNLIFRGKIFQRNKGVLDMLKTPMDSNDSEIIFNGKSTVGHGFIYTNSPNGNLQFGHPGYGGQNVKVDVENQLAFAYLTNDLKFEIGDEVKTFANLQKAVYESLENLE